MAERPKRKAIPPTVKLKVALRQDGKCTACGERLGALEGLNFDHRPAIIDRDVAPHGMDYVPEQLDPEYIEAIHIDCHKARTFGPGGEKRITTVGGDIHRKHKIRRLTEAEEETRRRVLAKTTAYLPADHENVGRDSRKPKRAWPSRPFNSKRKPK